MINLRKDVGVLNFIKETAQKQLVIIGIGIMFSDARAMIEKQGLVDKKYKSITLIDGDEKKLGQKTEFFDQKLEIKGYNYLEKYIGEEVAILVTSQQYADILYRLENDYANLSGATLYAFPDMKAKDLLPQEGSRKRFILFNIPTHSNIGDHAIASAEVEFLHDHFENQIVEITREDFNLYRINLRNYINKNDILMFTGGGNIGTLWESNNDVLLAMLEDYPNNKVFIFPQTIYYSDDEYGHKKHSKSLEIYNNHKNLTICARDEKTYKSAVEDYPSCQVVLMPDMVLYTNHVEPILSRDNIMLCLKKDKESILSEDSKSYLERLVREHVEKITINDTIAENNIDPKLRDKFIDDKIREFKKSELVITDRLHGMIFAAISNTPCIALNNVNHKMKYTYKWFNNLSHINFVDNIEDISENIIRMINVNGNYDDDSFAGKFEELANVIKDIVDT